MHCDIITYIANAEIKLSRLKLRLNCTDQVEIAKNRIILAERVPEEIHLPELPQHFKQHLFNKVIGRR